MENNENNSFENVVNIKVIGVGGGGNNTIHSMISEGIQGVEFIVANTDSQVLNASPADTIIQLGNGSTKGLGAGANPEIGRESAIETKDEIKRVLNGANMVIISAGMGGGTGTGAAPVIAKVARDLGALTVGVVTTPFSFEGAQRNKNAEIGLTRMKEFCDSLVVVSNNKLLKQYGGISLKDSFVYADKTLKQTVRAITDLIAVPALINLDFADVKSVMANRGKALVGIGKAAGEDRAIEAAIAAISSPILEASILGARDAIINISGGDITLDESNNAVEAIQKAAGSNLNIIFGVSLDENLGKDIQVSVIATGVSEAKEEISTLEIQKEVSDAIRSADLNLENASTKEILINNPFPNQSRDTIDDELALQNIPLDISDDDEDDIPRFLRNN